MILQIIFGCVIKGISGGQNLLMLREDHGVSNATMKGKEVDIISLIDKFKY